MDTIMANDAKEMGTDFLMVFIKAAGEPKAPSSKAI